MKIRQYILDNYEHQEIVDITTHGCSGGVHGLIYYTETVAFHDKFEEEIWDLLFEDAESHGLTVMQLIASFQDQKNVGSMTQLKNLLVWYAVERICLTILEEELTIEESMIEDEG